MKTYTEDEYKKYGRKQFFFGSAIVGFTMIVVLIPIFKIILPKQG